LDGRGILHLGVIDSSKSDGTLLVGFSKSNAKDSFRDVSSQERLVEKGGLLGSKSHNSIKVKSSLFDERVELELGSLGSVG